MEIDPCDDLLFVPDENYKPYTKNIKMSEFQKEQLEKKASFAWNLFYKRNQTKFFKDRHWIHREFPELFERKDVTLLECGCGVGNTVFPVSKLNPEMFIYCFDFSKEAVRLVLENKDYNEKKMKGFVCDMTKDDMKEVPDDSLDFVTLIFVLSALSPEKMKESVDKLYRKLKKGGIIFLRDYAVDDLSQIRFSKLNKIDENFFKRTDGTRTYFFSKEFSVQLFEKFKILENRYFEKNITNVKEEKFMDRIFIQGKFQKL